MLTARIDVHLPGVETERKQGFVDWVKGVFGSPRDLRSGFEQTTVSTLSLLQGLCTAFSRVAVTDAISLIVDKKVVYIDTAGIDNDLDILWAAAEQKRVLERPFKEMHLALNHVESGLHTLIDVAIKSVVPMGTAGLTIAFASRVEVLNVRPTETAESYAERVRSFAANPENLEYYRNILGNLVERCATELRALLVGASITVEPSAVRLIRPEAAQISRFRKLDFGSEASAPRYRPVPTEGRYGAYADPFFYYWYDPYYDFTSYLLLDAMLHQGAWARNDVYVVNPSGDLLFTGDRAESFARVDDAPVSFASNGALLVDSSIPDVDPNRSDFWGGGDSNWGSGSGDSASSDTSSSADSSGPDPSDWGSSDTSGSSCSSDTSGSSCGSSCSGSSCGSSCGSSSD